MKRATAHVPSVLLVEDEAIISMASEAILEDAGYKVITALNADEALEILRGNQDIDVVITDVQMPGTIDGLKLVELIETHFPHIETLVTSGRAGQSEARASGAKKSLPKPYTASAIQSAVKEVLASA